jgi:hypothetical protein
LAYKKQPENGFSGFQAASEISVAWVANPSRRYFCQTPRCSPDVILAQAESCRNFSNGLFLQVLSGINQDSRLRGGSVADLRKLMTLLGAIFWDKAFRLPENPQNLQKAA